jgi:leucyl aminopeptidase (aminopeptidase T)
MKRGENLFIETWSGTLPWASSLVLEARTLGVRPLLIVEDEADFWTSVDEAPTPNLGQVGSHEFAALKDADAAVYFLGPLDTKRWEALPQSLERRVMAIDHEWFRLSERYKVRSIRWDLGRTSELRARRYGVDLHRWRNELIEAAAYNPQALRRDGHRVAGPLRRGGELTISHPNGTDLKLRLVRRQPIVDDGVVDSADVRSGNVWTVVPGGVTLVTVDESYAEGTFVGNVPGVVFVRDRDSPLPAAKWTFRKGRLVEFSSGSGEEKFARAFAEMGPGKERPALVSIGLNPRLSASPLMFDQERGTVCIGIGRNSFYGGRTRSPRFTAYQGLRGASLTIDGRTVVDSGKIA